MAVCVLGSINLDTVLQTDSLPLPRQTVTARTVSEHLGGKGANQAIAAARIGAETIFLSARSGGTLSAAACASSLRMQAST